MRKSTVSRKTTETDIGLLLELDQSGESSVDTGIPFFDHMLRLMAFHAGMKMQLKARGDLEVDQHHTVEDVGICVGEGLREAMGGRGGIRRYGWAAAPMDESLALIALDISGRPHLAWQVELPVENVGGFDPLLAREFFQAMANQAGLTLHIRMLEAGNPHHVLEAVFKGVGLALGQAKEVATPEGRPPSTKGMLD